MKDLNLIIAQTFKISEEEAERNVAINDVAGWDSLSHMDLIVSIEEKYKIQLSGDDIADMLSFNLIRDILKKYIG